MVQAAGNSAVEVSRAFERYRNQMPDIALAEADLAQLARREADAAAQQVDARLYFDPPLTEHDEGALQYEQELEDEIDFEQQAAAEVQKWKDQEVRDEDKDLDSVREPVCSIAQLNVLRGTRLVVWDEVGMHSRCYSETLNAALHELCGSKYLDRMFP